MEKYQKINTVFKRDKKNKLIIGEFSDKETEYLKDMKWDATEKIDGTNIRVIWDCEAKKVRYEGKTDNAQIPAMLVNKLIELFPISLFEFAYPETSMTLYGEGYGVGIQNGGGYIQDSNDFIMFDVKIGKWWLSSENAREICGNLHCDFVPKIGEFTINEAIEFVKQGQLSTIQSGVNKKLAEGLVLKPSIDLYNKKGERIIVKIKHKDFN